VRPVPTVTIDFGDGRKLERTLTGNSIHYILDSQARTIDALPGLYGPKAFLHGLLSAETLFKSLAGKNDQQRNFMLSLYYSQQHNKIAAAWTIDTQKIGGKAPEGFRVVEGNNGEALLISPMAMTKAVTEANILRAMTSATEELGKITDETGWRKIAQLHSSDAVLDDRSISLIKHQNPNLTERELAQLVQKFQDSIALDTVRNEYLMHSKLYTWIVKDPVRDDVEKLNEQVYAKLFLTPNSDPWLGLFSADVYTALDNGGVKKQ
jgi:CHAT domain-containing protein